MKNGKEEMKQPLQAKLCDITSLKVDAIVNAAYLANCYRNSLELAREYDLHSIAFSAISTGVYGYPLKEATKIAVDTVRDWLDAHKDYEIRIIFSCFSREVEEMYQKYLK